MWRCKQLTSHAFPAPFHGVGFWSASQNESPSPPRGEAGSKHEWLAGKRRLRMLSSTEVGPCGKGGLIRVPFNRRPSYWPVAGMSN